MINIFSENYPELLKQLHKPPSLNCKGNLDILEKISIAIVGTRFNSEYGEYVTEKLVEELSVIDINIVSGLARGIDTIAHKAALKNGLSTIAVLGSGLRNIYPKENNELALEITKNGLLVSEYSENSAPIKMNFPERNRIISGLSVATIVIEAPDKSGALITADFALDQGREVFVVPGDIDRPTSGGILKLLQKSAAYPISSGQEIIEILKVQPPLFKENNINKDMTNKLINYRLNFDESTVLKLITKRGIDLDKIIITSKLPINRVLSALSLLEIKELILTRGDKYKLYA